VLDYLTSVLSPLWNRRSQPLPGNSTSNEWISTRLPHADTFAK
jgi:hypothetical protein